MSYLIEANEVVLRRPYQQAGEVVFKNGSEANYSGIRFASNTKFTDGIKTFLGGKVYIINDGNNLVFKNKDDDTELMKLEV